LEKSLTEFNGAVILVTHDRYFMDAVSNQILAFPPEHHSDRLLQKFASYLQWEEWYSTTGKQPEEPAAADQPKTKEAKKLSFKEKFEFENMETTIHELEGALEKATSEGAHTEMARLQTEIEKKYARWAELEAKAGKGS